MNLTEKIEYSINRLKLEESLWKKSFAVFFIRYKIVQE